MLFTIVTPVLNGMPWLPAAVDSVAQQRGTADVEHIVVDGGSTDGSREWLTGQAADRCRMILESDRGQTDALIRGFAQASGDILGWLNADDLLEAGALARVASTLQDHPGAVAVSGGCLLIGPDGEVVGSIPLPPEATLAGLLECPTNLAQPATFFRREAYEQVGGLDRSLDLAMDVDLWLKLATLGPIVLLRDETLASFRVRAGAKSRRMQGRTARQDLAIRLRRGMGLLTPAGRSLIRWGFVDPVLRRIGATRAAGR